MEARQDGDRTYADAGWHLGINLGDLDPYDLDYSHEWHEILDQLKRRFPKEIAHVVMGYSVKVDEAQSRGLSIFEYAPSNRGAKIMAALAEELEARDKPAFGAV